MTYRAELQTVELSDFSFSHTGFFNTNDYMNITTRNNNTSGLSVSTSTMTLPAGNYLVKAMLGTDRTSDTDDFTYQLELNGSLVGNVGQTETATSKKVGVDHVAHAFSLQENGSLRLKITYATSNDWTVETDYSYLIVTRCV